MKFQELQMSPLNEYQNIINALLKSQNNDRLYDYQKAEALAMASALKTMQQNIYLLSIESKKNLTEAISKLYPLYNTKDFYFTSDLLEKTKDIIVPCAKQIRSALITQAREISKLDEVVELFGNMVHNRSILLSEKSDKLADAFELHLSISEVKDSLGGHELSVLLENLSVFSNLFEDLLNGSNYSNRTDDMVFLGLLMDYSEKFLTLTALNNSKRVLQTKQSIRKIGASAKATLGTITQKSRLDENINELKVMGLFPSRGEFPPQRQLIALYNPNNSGLNLNPPTDRSRLLGFLNTFINQYQQTSETDISILGRALQWCVALWNGTSRDTPDYTVTEIAPEGVLLKPPADKTIIKGSTRIEHIVGEVIVENGAILTANTLSDGAKVVVEYGGELRLAWMIGGEVYVQGTTAKIKRMTGGVLKFTLSSRVTIEQPIAGYIGGNDFFNLECPKLPPEVTRNFDAWQR
jgi:hypothetical protein